MSNTVNTAEATSNAVAAMQETLAAERERYTAVFSAFQARKATRREAHQRFVAGEIERRYAAHIQDLPLAVKMAVVRSGDEPGVLAGERQQIAETVRREFPEDASHYGPIAPGILSVLDRLPPAAAALRDYAVASKLIADLLEREQAWLQADEARRHREAIEKEVRRIQRLKADAEAILRQRALLAEAVELGLVIDPNGAI